MAEGIGLVVGAASLIIQLGTLYKNKSVSLHHLEEDLKSFHEFLRLTQDDLSRQHHIRTRCEELIIDIEYLVSRNARRSRWRRNVALSAAELQALRDRLNFQISLLGKINTQIGCTQKHAPGERNSLVDLSLLKNQPFVQNTGSLDAHIASNLQPVRSSVIYECPAWDPSLQRPVPSASSRASSYGDSIFSSDLNDSPLTPQSSTRLSSHSVNSGPQMSFDADDTLPTNDLYADSRHIRRGGADQVRIERDDRGYSGCDIVNDLNHGRTPLIWAIVDGNINRVEDLLQQGTDVEDPDGQWTWTPLIWAAVESKLEIVKALLKAGADPRATDAKVGRTPLAWAASMGANLAIDVLLQHDPSLINAEDKKRMTPLALAYDGGYTDTAKCLVRYTSPRSLHYGAEGSLLSLAIIARDRNFARTLLKRGVDVRKAVFGGAGPLILAIQQNLIDIVESLLENGADVQCSDEHGTAALTIAIQQQHVDIAETLLQRGAQLEAKGRDGNTALLWAIWHHDETGVDLLVASGARVDIVDDEGKTAEHWARTTHNEHIIRLVARSGARPDVAARRSWTDT
ncbi:hypothetical protein ACN47E_006689 [Coniothyrium glycines]